MTTRCVQVCVHIPASVVERMDALVKMGLFRNRSDLVREAVRRLLLEYERMLLRKEPSPAIGVR